MFGASRGLTFISVISVGGVRNPCSVVASTARHRPHDCDLTSSPIRSLSRSRSRSRSCSCSCRARSRECVKGGNGWLNTSVDDIEGASWMSTVRSVRCWQCPRRQADGYHMESGNRGNLHPVAVSTVLSIYL